MVENLVNIYDLIRVTSTRWGTFGVWLDDDKVPLFVTLEDEWLDNEIGKSCVPEGVYICEPFSSDKFGEVWRLDPTQPRTAILIHAGNTNDDTRGCILPGMNYGMLGVSYAVLQSKTALNILRKQESGNTFVLCIGNSF